MDLEFTDEQLALRDNARTVLAGACPPSLVRSVHDGLATAADQVDQLHAMLVGLGWPAIGIPEEFGGLGLGFVEVGVVVEELARVVAPSPLLPTLTQLGALAASAGAGSLLASIAAGEVTGTLAVAERGDWRPERWATTARRAGSGWVLDGTKSHVLGAVPGSQLAVVAAATDGQGAFLVPFDASGVAAAPVEVLDPTWPLATVDLRGVEVSDDRVLVEPGDPGASLAIERALDEATAAMALSTVATCRAIFERTLQYAKNREQFGRPIGSFQALKHRLADDYLAVERAAALAWVAALTIAEDDPRRAVAVAMAKAGAGDCQRLVVTDGLQLHGGVGFTWEHDLHFLLKRATTGDLLFGGAAQHRARLVGLLGLLGVEAVA